MTRDYLDPLDYLNRFILPAAYACLPQKMATPHASALLLAIALQESAVAHRRQVRGPARGFWQFEVIGVRGVLEHHATKSAAIAALAHLVYPPTLPAKAVQLALEHNDVLAAVLARLALWSLRAALPTIDHVDGAWTQYLAAWRPGKPHRETWAGNYARAWSLIEKGER